MDDKEKFQKVLDKFNFERVRAFMVLTNWTWGHSDEVPSIYHMQEICWELYDSLQRFGVRQVATGGFELFFNKNPNNDEGEEEILLKFVAEESIYFGDGSTMNAREE